MKESEKEKIILKFVKEFSKTGGWKFRRDYIVKKVGRMLYHANFSLHWKKNIIGGWLAFKPLNWTIFFGTMNQEIKSNQLLSGQSQLSVLNRLLYLAITLNLQQLTTLFAK